MHKRNRPEQDLVHLPLMERARLNPICREYLLHIGNERKSSPYVGKIMKDLGVMAGASDLFLAVPNGRYAGYFIELKSLGKKPTKIQSEFLAKMKKIGYCTDWFDNWEKAWDSIENYLQGINNV